MAKQILDNSEGNDMEQLKRFADESQDVRPRKRRFHDVQPMTQYPTQDGDDENSNDNMLQRAGYIKEIKLTNFMCHANFSLRLGPRLNFIVGNNGSGKSAILTAITIGLGAKATTTNRGTSLKDLIKQGCNTSKIVIVLCNSGINRYEPTIYGKEIRIERTIRRGGQSGTFSIRSETNKEISSKKRDLEAILDYFSIPVTNPMCFLSQDAARSFLTASTPQEKHLHFMKGTLLEETKQNLESAVNTMVLSKNRLSILKENVGMLHKDFENAQTILTQLVSKNDWITHRRLLQGKHMWLVYQSNNQKLIAIRSRASTLTAKKQEYLNRISDAENKVERYLIQKEEAIKDVSKKLTDRQNIEADRSSLQIEIEKFRSKHAQLKQQRQITLDDLKSSEKAQVRTRRELAEAERRLQTQIGENETDSKEQLRKIRSEIEEHKNKRRPALLKHQDELDTQIASLRQDSEPSIEDFKKNIAKKKQELGEQNSSEDNLGNGFDKNMPLVRRKINERRNDFSSLPIGPIGYHVRVKTGYEHFAFLIQTHINPTLEAFVVKEVGDAVLLKEIFESCQLRKIPSVITHELQPFDYIRGKATSCLTVSDALAFDVPGLEFLLVDTNRMEKTVLAKSKKEGDYILREERPRNVNLVLALNNSNSGLHMALTAGSSMRLNNFQFAYNLKMKVGSNNQTFLKNEIRKQEQELEERKDEYNKQITDIRAQKEEISEEFSNSLKETKRLARLAEELEDKLNRRNNSDHIDALKESIAEEKEQLEQLKANLSSIEQKIGDLGLQLQPVKERYDSVTRKYQDACSAYEAARDLEQSISHKVDKCRANILETQRKISTVNDKRASCEAELSTMQSKCERQLEQTLQFCTEDEILCSDLPDSEEIILKEIRKIDENVRASERQLGMTQDEITKLCENSKRKYEISIEKYKELDVSLQKVHTALTLRQAALDLSIKGTRSDADIDFRISMKTRLGYSGSLSFANPGQLNVMVKTANDHDARNVDTLSGGEKSFSQIALLLATWLTMRSRIIALDEFDVFMDQVNRKIGTNLIIRRLGKDVKSDTQTIIITPQDIGKMANIDDSYVSIHKMKNPERHNQVSSV
ncbi:unnamed protein product [Kluyveromyces dobzhanskii CBS 2104]|uniref:WGS project CCBQ000000000 data, contig 00106 n=1 Tax=Kluyveromyces dobzhanskii CBS 2104 TaxID=1427455 RepID=A0A0A8L636_9SACH|nr:unnamed protein product [Kluyveromyces dobzhanskii CBS 2104]